MRSFKCIEVGVSLKKKEKGSHVYSNLWFFRVKDERRFLA